MAIELVVKIGSMALLSKESGDINYNLFSRLSKELKPGMALVTSGAAEIGRLDYLERNGKELVGDNEAVKTDYCAQGQTILMDLYREFVPSSYSIRQVLVEHQHFNDDVKREHLKNLLLRASDQNAIPIINYNDAVCNTETMRMEIAALQKKQRVVECIDNDETAAQIARLVNAKTLLILTSADGIYEESDKPETLVRTISGTTSELREKIDYLMTRCKGASRKGAGGARSKLEYVYPAAINGTRVFIANAKFPIGDVLSRKAPSTEIFLSK